MCGRSARIVRSTSCGVCVGSSARSRGADLVRVGDVGLVLLDRRGPLVEHLDQQVGADRLQPRGERAVVVVGLDRRARERVHRARSPIPAVTRMIATPVSASPAMIARSIGAAPRQRGSSDGWTLIIS